MAYEVKPNTGSLFKNEKREADTHAHAKGSALIDGVEYWVDAWTNTSANGTKYQSLKFKPKDGARTPASVSQRDYIPSRADEDDSDEIPF
jgi:hypothetical protein